LAFILLNSCEQKVKSSVQIYFLISFSTLCFNKIRLPAGIRPVGIFFKSESKPLRV